MCAIGGSLWDKGETRRMLDRMLSRGPDGSAVQTVGVWTLGVNRLAIIDPKAEETAPCAFGGFLLAMNGEIYNHQDIRKDLVHKGHSFRTKTDTETLVHAWAEWGENCLDRLNGMFAFAIADGTTAWLVRDRAGEKPLYFSRHKKGFFFASEAQAVASTTGAGERNDAFFNRYEYCHGKTLWKGVMEVLPAELVRIDAKGVPTRRIWWTPKKVEIDAANADKQLEVILEDAVRLRLLSDQPVVLYRSGGIDSELIQTFLPDTVESVTFDEHAPDHQKTFQNALPAIVKGLDLPVGSFSPYGLWWLAREARKAGAKVVLSGEGADELFGGYARTIIFAEMLRVRDQMPGYEPLFRKAFGLPEDIYARLTSRGHQRHLIVNDIGYFDDPPLTMACKFEFHTLLPMLLQMGDRMAMLHGVENRCPFLDHRVIEFAWSLPWDEWRVLDGKGKTILRKILERRSPGNPALTAPKKGLFVPVNEWLGVGHGDYSRRAWLETQLSLWRS